MTTKKLDHDKHADLLRAAFNIVCDETNWKNPIDAEVPCESAGLYREAVTFMTGSVPEFGKPYTIPHPIPSFGPVWVVRMTAVGYYAAVGA